MRVQAIRVNKFKRFTDLHITGLPETARLVVLVGPNGCGKSSLFDAMNHHDHRARAQYAMDAGELGYYSKGFVPGVSDQSQRGMTVQIALHGATSPFDGRGKFHIRSAYRHVSELDGSRFSLANEEHHTLYRLPRLTSNDAEIPANYHRLRSQAMDKLFKGGKTTADEIIASMISPIRDALLRVMPDLRLRSLDNPQSGVSTFYFAKGEVDLYTYDNLSGGERAAFDLLLDMAIKRDLFPDAVHCIDEPESHIAMGVQGKLLEVMFDFIPENSQLWIGTHSIGMLRKASEIALQRPGEVVFLDFNGRNFDGPVVITPATPDREFWKKMHEVALDDLATLVAPDTIVICESQKGFDAKCYNRIFSSEYPQVQFASVGGKGILDAVRLAWKGAEIGTNLLTLRDRDTMTSEQVGSYRAQGGRVLSRACIEEYLLDDEVLRTLCQKYECPDSFSRIREIREKAKHPKAAVGQIHTAMLELSGNAPIGDTRDAFMKDTLAPLITPDTAVYRQLKADVFGQ